jgi:hypothetical protein
MAAHPAPQLQQSSHLVDNTAVSPTLFVRLMPGWGYGGEIPNYNSKHKPSCTFLHVNANVCNVVKVVNSVFANDYQ